MPRFQRTDSLPPLLRIAILLILLCLLPACTTTKPTLVLLVGGSGLSQLGDLSETISAACPDADVIETGGWDGFRANLQQYVKQHPGQAIVLIGHSFGCQTIANAAQDMPYVELVVMIDPAWDDITLPGTVRSCLWYQRSDDGAERKATVINGGFPQIISGDHAGICHSPRLISEVTQVVRDISYRAAMMENLRHPKTGPG